MCRELSEIQKLNWGELAVIDELVSCVIGGPFFKTQTSLPQKSGIDIRIFLKYFFSLTLGWVQKQTQTHWEQTVAPWWNRVSI